jgi:CO/xanthine dehydrogenase FAD-binding subunit
LGGVSAVPIRATKAESLCNNAVLSDELMREAGEIAASEAEPMTDPHGSADYRTKMVKFFVRRAMAAAMAQLERNGNGKA